MRGALPAHAHGCLIIMTVTVAQIVGLLLVGVTLLQVLVLGRLFFLKQLANSFDLLLALLALLCWQSDV